MTQFYRFSEYVVLHSFVFFGGDISIIFRANKALGPKYLVNSLSISGADSAIIAYE